MRFKTQQSNPPLPNIDLIPMLNVMMSVLAFFVLISMTLNPAPAGLDIPLPKDEEATDKPSKIELDDLTIQLKANEQIWLGETQLANSEELLVRVRAYLQTDSRGNILLNADPNVAYERVIEILLALREIGGNRVLLAIQEG